MISFSLRESLGTFNNCVARSLSLNTHARPRVSTPCSRKWHNTTAQFLRWKCRHYTIDISTINLCVCLRYHSAFPFNIYPFLSSSNFRRRGMDSMRFLNNSIGFESSRRFSRILREKSLLAICDAVCFNTDGDVVKSKRERRGHCQSRAMGHSSYVTKRRRMSLGHAGWTF